MSIGVDRLLFALDQANTIKTKKNEPVLVCILDIKYSKKYFFDEFLESFRMRYLKLLYRDNSHVVFEVVYPKENSLSFKSSSAKFGTASHFRFIPPFLSDNISLLLLMLFCIPFTRCLINEI